MQYLLSAILLSLAMGAQAELYKWVDSEGVVHFTNTPPENREVEPLDLGRINTYEGLRPAEPGAVLPPPSRDVVLYSASWCSVCDKARAYFRSRDIDFREYDVETSWRGRRDYRSMDGQGVPIIIVGENRMDGFSISRFQRLYRQR